MASMLRSALNSPISSYREWVVIFGAAALFVLMPQLPDNDWFRNASDLPNGLAIYSNPAYVYPPWALILFIPYYLVGAAGARVLSVIVIGALMHKYHFSISHFLSLIISPLFLWTLGLSSADVLILVIPMLLWTNTGRWASLRGGLAFAILLLKPQVGIALAIPRLWALRRDPRRLFWLLAFTAAITLPISLLGDPPLFAQWLRNLMNPAGENPGFWESNTLSMTTRYGLIPALIIVVGAFGALYVFMRRRQQAWTDRHTDSTFLTASMLLAPYASNQSAIVPLTLHPSWIMTLAQYIGVFGAAVLDIYAQADDWLVLGFVLLAMSLPLFFHRTKESELEPHAQTN